MSEVDIYKLIGAGAGVLLFIIIIVIIVVAVIIYRRRKSPVKSGEYVTACIPIYVRRSEPCTKGNHYALLSVSLSFRDFRVITAKIARNVLR